MRTGFLSVVLALVAVLQSGEGLGATRSESACAKTNAVPTTILEVNRDLDAWRGKCVSIDALLFEGRIYADREATLDDVPSESDDRSKSQMLRLNLEKGFPTLAGRPHGVRVVGRIGSCQDAYDSLDEYRQEHRGEIFVLAGLCHYTIENFIVPISVTNIDSGAAIRLTESEVLEDRRRLRAISEDELTVAAPYIAAAEQWIEAFARGDWRSALRLAFAEYEELMQARQRGEPYKGLEENFRKVSAGYNKANRRLAFVTKFKGTAPGRVYVKKGFGETDYETISGVGHGTYTMCWCKTADCSKRWPIAPWDADNDPRRPYFCIEAVDYVMFRQGISIQVEVPLSKSGFAEPDWPSG